jgi:hypothetical protein
VILDTSEGEAALAANCCGVKYLSAECGRSQLYSARQAAILCRASNRFQNQLTLRHSSRKPAVKTFHVRILRGLARLNVNGIDSLLDAPGKVMP